MKVTITPIVIGAFAMATKWPGGFGSCQLSGDHLNNSIIENVQNTEKSPADLRRLAVTQFSGKDHQLTPM